MPKPGHGEPLSRSFTARMDSLLLANLDPQLGLRV